MSQNEAIELLGKYLNGQCSEGESRRVEAWLEQVNNGDNEWAGLSDEDRKAYIQSLYYDLQKKTVGRSGKRHYLKLWQYAAVAVLFLAATYGVLFVTVFNSGQSTQVVSVRDYASTSTGVGEMKEVTLKDGTKVWLNAMSALKYPPTFNGNTREVYIKGEAFFEVAKNAEKPFIVHSGALKTKVLGTSFNVDAYSNNEIIDIAVMSGKVEVSEEEAGEMVKLLKNEQVNYTKNGTVLLKRKITHSASYLAWRQGKMHFYHTSMKEVAKVLYRNYGVDIQFENEDIQKYEITGQFDKKEDIKSVLKAVCLSIGGKFSMKENKAQLFIK